MLRARVCLRWAVRAGISAALLAYISYDVDHADLRAALSAVDLRDLVLPLGLFLAGQVLSAVEVVAARLLGRASSRPLADYLRFYFIGMFLNVFGLGTIGGDVVRGLYLGDGRPARPRASTRVIFDRLSGLAILMALGARRARSPFPQLPLPAGAQRGPDRRRASGSSWAGGPARGWSACLPAREPRPPAAWSTTSRPSGATAGCSGVSSCSRRSFHSLAGRSAVPDRDRGRHVARLLLLPGHASPAEPDDGAPAQHRRLRGARGRLPRTSSPASTSTTRSPVTMGLLWWLMGALSGVVGALVFLASGAALPRMRSRPGQDLRGAAEGPRPSI